MIRRIQQYFIYADKKTREKNFERVGFFFSGMLFMAIIQVIIARGYVL